VHDDGVADALSGNGGLDWFFASLADSTDWDASLGEQTVRSEHWGPRGSTSTFNEKDAWLASLSSLNKVEGSGRGEYQSLPAHFR